MSLTGIGQAGWGRVPPRNPLANPLVRPFAVEVFDVFLDYPMELPVPDNQQVIEAFSPQACCRADGILGQGTCSFSGSCHSMVAVLSCSRERELP